MDRAAGEEVNDEEKAFVAVSVAVRAADKRRAEDSLQREQLQLAGLKIAAGEAKYFSFLNSADPINNLKSYGWKVWSDDYWSFGRYRYYAVIQHPHVRNNGYIILVRILEFDEIREVKAPNADGKQPWEVQLEKMIGGERGGPVLVLDYSYFGLLADKAAHVGGMIYASGANLKGIEFYAPLDQWSEKLNTLFSGETQGIH